MLNNRVDITRIASDVSRACCLFQRTDRYFWFGARVRNKDSRNFGP